MRSGQEHAKCQNSKDKIKRLHKLLEDHGFGYLMIIGLKDYHDEGLIINIP